MELIDLSFPIKDHWRCGYKQTLKNTLENGDDFRSSVMTLPAHAFTHVDTLLHCKPGGAPALDELPVDTYSGSASIIDLSFVDAGHKITATDLEEHAKDIKAGDIILLKTCWDKKRDVQSKEYWSDAPFVSEEAANWLLAKSPKAVGFDFPQDEILRQAATYKGCLPMSASTTHYALLLKGVFLIEYLAGLDQIKQDRITFMALPLKLVGVEGCPVRAVAIKSI